MNTQQSISAWTMGLGQLLLAAILVLCLVDISGLAGRGSLMIPLSGYLTGISTGVAMQFIGSAIAHMKFKSAK